MIEAGEHSFTYNFTDNSGHFEKGRWVTQFTPLFDVLMPPGTDYKPSFGVSYTIKIPIFKQGACIGEREETHDLGTFTVGEVTYQ